VNAGQYCFKEVYLLYDYVVQLTRHLPSHHVSQRSLTVIAAKCAYISFTLIFWAKIDLKLKKLHLCDRHTLVLYRSQLCAPVILLFIFGH